MSTDERWRRTAGDEGGRQNLAFLRPKRRAWDRRSRRTAKDVAAVVARVRDARDALSLTGEIVPFGSHVTGFSTANSDCDLSYMPPEGSSTETPIWVLQRFANELPKHGFEGIITIFQALIPLIKAVDPSGIEVDLCVGNLLGLQNSKLIAAYCSLDSRVGEVGRHVKQWAKAWELVGSSDGHLNSYAYTLLTIYYLMHTRPPVVPNLQDLAKPPHHDGDLVIVSDRRWGRERDWDCSFWSDIHLVPKSENTESVESLFQGFFDFYTTFDWGSHAVSIRTALTERFTLKSNLEGPVQKDQWYVEDPFDLRHNLASQCTKDGRQRILDRMSDTLKVLTTSSNTTLPCYAVHCARKQTTFMLKCRVHTDKVTITDFVAAFGAVPVLEPFVVWFPTAAYAARAREAVMDAFLVFKREDDRRRVHRLNETKVGEWQLRLLPCSPYAFEDAKSAGKYEDVEVPPRGSLLEEEVAERVDAVSEEVRSNLRVAQTTQEVSDLVELAHAMKLPHEEKMCKKRLRELKSAEQGSAASADEPAVEFRFQ